MTRAALAYLPRPASPRPADARPAPRRAYHNPFSRYPSVQPKPRLGVKNSAPQNAPGLTLKTHANPPGITPVAEDVVVGCSVAAERVPRITWVDENVGLKGLAKDYNDSAMGARSNILTKSGQAPALERMMPDGTTRLVKFDGVDGSIMIDRKLSIVTTSKAQAQALRQSEVLNQNGLTGLWEVPSVAQQNRAVKMLNNLNISNISVQVVKPW
jgi:hypothetical protein